MALAVLVLHTAEQYYVSGTTKWQYQLYFIAQPFMLVAVTALCIQLNFLTIQVIAFLSHPIIGTTKVCHAGLIKKPAG